MKTPATISVSYKLYNEDLSFSIRVSYQIAREDNIQVISCAIAEQENPAHHWLQLRKFELRSSFHKGRYTPLYNEKNDASNIDTTLFIDQTCMDIMKREKMQQA